MLETIFGNLLNAPIAQLPVAGLGGVSLSDAKDQIADAAASAGVGAPTSKKIELYTPEYYYTCAFGGVLACGTTHAFVTPLDVVKVRKQVDKNIYKSNFDGWSKIYKNEGGVKGLYTGFVPTFFGYSVQGAAKYGLYEVFKKKYADFVGPEAAEQYKSALYLAGSASAEFFADLGLVPFESIKVRVQTQMPRQLGGLTDGIPKVIASEGAGALFASISSLWGRQIPYTMMKFWSFEATVTQIYKQLGKPKDEFNKLQQLGVSFAAGYIAGIFCATVSHPADTLVSKLNAPVAPGAAKPTVGSIYKDIGFGGLWGGLGTRIFMVGTLTGLQWLIYDYVKVIFGLPTTGHVEKKE